MKPSVPPLAFAAFALLCGAGCNPPADTGPKPCVAKTCEVEGWQCGTLDDGCGGRVECGTCQAPLLCGGGDEPHVCAPCRAETTAAFCARYERDCGYFTGENLCGASRSVNCGNNCADPMSCGGGGVAGRCGTPECQPETEAQLCARLSRTCGELTAADNCSQQRTVDCGECPDAAVVVPPGPDAAQPAGPDAAAPVDPPDAAYVEPPDADPVEPGPDAEVVIDPPDAGAPLDHDAGVQACAAESTKAQLLPLDIYFMLDQSGSMDSYVGSADAGTRMTAWQAVTSAVDAFISQPLTGVSAGIQYFGLPPSGQSQCTIYSCTKDSDCGAGCGPCEYDWYYGDQYCAGYSWSYDDSCVAADYATPDVEIALLPGVAPAIRASLAAHSPNTLTPTSAALEGAILHAKQWAIAHPGHVAIDILATDGQPVGCIEDMATINGIAAAGLSGTPSIRTFVIGVGTSLTNLDGIAAAGGTGQAFLVDTSTNVSAQMLAALNAIRGAALGCAYSIPPPTTGTLDLTKVNVQYTPGGGGTPAMLVQVLDETHCPAGADGWHYDSATNPTQIVLCPDTCQKVQADTSGQVDILIGCATQHCPPTMVCGFGF